MTITSVWQDVVRKILDSPLLHGAMTAGMIFLAIVGGLAIIAIVTFGLSKLFHRDPNIRFIHRVSIYLLTIGGIIICLFGALLGFVLPVIPGILLLGIAVILLRRVYRNQWMEDRITWIQWKLRLKRKVVKARKNMKENVMEAHQKIKKKIGKSLRKVKLQKTQR